MYCVATTVGSAPGCPRKIQGNEMTSLTYRSLMVLQSVTSRLLGGVLLRCLDLQNTLTVLTRTQYMTLDANNNSDIELYKDRVSNITRFTPSIYRGMIVDSIERDSEQAKVERYGFKKKGWVLF